MVIVAQVRVLPSGYSSPLLASQLGDADATAAVIVSLRSGPWQTFAPQALLAPSLLRVVSPFRRRWLVAAVAAMNAAGGPRASAPPRSESLDASPSADAVDEPLFVVSAERPVVAAAEFVAITALPLITAPTAPTPAPTPAADAGAGAGAVADVGFGADADIAAAIAAVLAGDDLAARSYRSRPLGSEYGSLPVAPPHRPVAPPHWQRSRSSYGQRQQRRVQQQRRRVQPPSKPSLLAQPATVTLDVASMVDLPLHPSTVCDAVYQAVFASMSAVTVLLYRTAAALDHDAALAEYVRQQTATGSLVVVFTAAHVSGSVKEVIDAHVAAGRLPVVVHVTASDGGGSNSGGVPSTAHVRVTLPRPNVTGATIGPDPALDAELSLPAVPAADAGVLQGRVSWLKHAEFPYPVSAAPVSSSSVIARDGPPVPTELGWLDIVGDNAALVDALQHRAHGHCRLTVDPALAPLVASLVGTPPWHMFRAFARVTFQFQPRSLEPLVRPFSVDAFPVESSGLDEPAPWCLSVTVASPQLSWTSPSESVTAFQQYFSPMAWWGTQSQLHAYVQAANARLAAAGVVTVVDCPTIAMAVEVGAEPLLVDADHARMSGLSTRASMKHSLAGAQMVTLCAGKHGTRGVHACMRCVLAFRVIVIIGGGCCGCATVWRCC